MSLWHSRQKIDRYLAGNLAGEKQLRHHISVCAACRAYYDEGVLALRAARVDRGSAGVGELERIARRALAAVAPPMPKRRRRLTQRPAAEAR